MNYESPIMAILVLLFSEKKKRHLGASWWWCHQRDKRRDYTDEARFEENKVIKKGNVWGNFFLAFICTSTKNQQSAIWISKIWPLWNCQLIVLPKGRKTRLYWWGAQEENKAIKKGGENIAGITNALLVAMHNSFLFY